jgi:hypothetical protein
MLNVSEAAALELITQRHHHPIPHNLSSMHVLRLSKYLGSATENADGKYSLTINDAHAIFHRPHSKHLNAREITQLRHYLVDRV